MTNIDYENLSVNGFAIHKVDKFLIETGMQPYKLGLEACGSSNFYDRLIRGKARLATIAQVETYIDEQRKLMHIPLPIDAPLMQAEESKIDFDSFNTNGPNEIIKAGKGRYAKEIDLLDEYLNMSDAEMDARDRLYACGY